MSPNNKISNIVKECFSRPVAVLRNYSWAPFIRTFKELSKIVRIIEGSKNRGFERVILKE